MPESKPQTAQGSNEEIVRGEDRGSDLGIACWTQPAFVFRQVSSMYSWLQALLMVPSIAVTITQHDVIVLHQTHCAVNTTACYKFDSMLGGSMLSEAVQSASGAIAA